MTSPLLGAPARSDGGPGPVVRLSASALRENAGRLQAEPIPDRAGDALAADAYGHGANWVRSILSEFDALDLVDIDADALYGLGVDTRPVMRLSGTVTSTKRLRAGEGVSYGYTHRAVADTRIALVSGGYAQGVVRRLGNRAGVRVGGSTRPIVGRVAMDVCVVDIGDLDVDRGDEVVFFGDPADGDPSVRHWSAATGLTVGELTAAVGLHTRRLVQP